MGSNVEQTTPEEEQGSNPRNRDLQGVHPRVGHEVGRAEDQRLQAGRGGGDRVQPGKASSVPDLESRQSREKILAALELIAVIGGTAAGFLAVLGVTGLRPFSVGLLVVAALALPLLWFFTDLSNSKVFNVSILTVLTLVLAGAGVYVGLLHENHSDSQSPRFPAVSFDDPEQANVPWCNVYDLTTSGAIPNGYKLAVFAAGTGQNYNVGEGYIWAGNATPVEGGRNQWITPLVYIGPPSSAHKVYRGFRGVMVAVILSNQSSSILSATIGQEAGSEAPAYKTLPPGTVRATEYVRRNGVISGC
jgi:hypothetical protein